MQRNDSTTSAPLIEVRSQLKANELEIANREHAIAALQSEINGYQARLSNTPIREQELTDLNRDYDQSKAFYDQLLTKKNEAIMAGEDYPRAAGRPLHHAGSAQQADQAIFAKPLQAGHAGLIRWIGDGAGGCRGSRVPG